MSGPNGLGTFSIEKAVLISTSTILALGGLYTFWEIYAFSQARFFTVDEYMYGHQTWLVARGALPYVDFYEHHFPLSSVLHAPLYWIRWDFVTGALLLRKIVFAYLLGLSLLAGFCCYRVTRNPMAALMTVFVPVSFGFALMSFVDYRADSFGVFYFGACLVLLEWNRKKGSVALAVIAGVLAVIASGMTQKMVMIGGGTVLAMFVCDKVAALPALRSRLTSDPFLSHPKWFFGSVFVSGALLLAGAAALGIVSRGFELTVLQALEHERIYEPFSVFGRGYVTPFWETAWISTVPLIAFAVLHLVTPAGRFWIFPIAVAAFACVMMVAPYPYNFVFICWMAVVVAVRGFCQVLTWLGEIAPRLRTVIPALCVVSLAVVANQHRFVAGTTTNAHQLRVLERIETYGSPADSVIDGAGGAMFSWDASYYFYHGQAHRKMFLEYFATELPEDYRRSRSLFWIKDMRAAGLPKAALDYLHGNYIDGGGDLWVIGYTTPETGREPTTISIDFVREGEYYFHHTRKIRGRGGRRPNIWVDGAPLLRNRFYFEERRYEIRIGPQTGQFVITPVKTGFFDQAAPTRPHYTMLFEYGEWERSRGSEGASAAPQRD